MLTVRLRNLLLGWPDPVAEAKLYVDPAGQVYPAPANDRDTFVASNAAGEARITGLTPGPHTLWIVPKLASPDPVGHATGTGPDAGRIYRGLRVELAVGDRNNVTQAVVHASTAENGRVVAQVANVKAQVLDVRLQPTWIRSPYHYKRTLPIDMIVVHKTGGEVIGPAINQFLSGGSSAHYIVDRDGQVVKMVLDGRAAGHASHEDGRDQSHWGTQTGLAWRSIGIENVGTVKQGLTDPQYRSLIRLIHELMRTHGIPRHRVLAHSDILTDGQGVLSDDRVACPGHQFDWPRLEAASPPIGLARSGGAAVREDPVADFFRRMNSGTSPGGSGPMVLRLGDFDPQVVAGKARPGRFNGKEAKDVAETPITLLQTWLAGIGYSVGPADGRFSKRTARAARHFQVRFEGKANTETVDEQTAALIRAVWHANPTAE